MRVHRIWFLLAVCPQVLGYGLRERQGRFKKAENKRSGKNRKWKLPTMAKDIKCNKEAAEVCPVAVIKII